MDRQARDCPSVLLRRRRWRGSMSKYHTALHQMEPTQTKPHHTAPLHTTVSHHNTPHHTTPHHTTPHRAAKKNTWYHSSRYELGLVDTRHVLVTVERKAVCTDGTHIGTKRKRKAFLKHISKAYLESISQKHIFGQTKRISGLTQASDI